MEETNNSLKGSENKMAELKKVGMIVLVTFLVSMILFLLGTIVFNKFTEKKEPQEKVDSTLVIDRISDEAFLVTKTVVVDQETKIVVDQGSAWSNFWWGETIEAEALIRLDIGVDFSLIKEEDIIVNDETKTIRISLPKVDVLDASQFGDIEVRSSKGVLKFFLENDPNKDHNQALNELIDKSKESILSDEELYTEAKENAVGLLELIVKDLGYTLDVE